MQKEKTKLKIGLVLDSTLDVEDGVQQYILTLGSFLKTKGHEVHYIVGQTNRTDIANLHSLTKNLILRFNGNRVSISLPAPSKPIKQLIKKENFDILHIQSPYSPFYAGKFVKYAQENTAILGTFHILSFNIVAKIGTRLLGLALSKNLKKFDSQISVSSANKIFAKQTFKIDCKVIPNMVNIDKFKQPKNYKRNNKVPEILFLGRLTERKGCMYLIEACAELSKQYPEIKFKLNIAGKGENEANLKKRVSELNLLGYVEFFGFVTNEKKIELMRRADVAVFPSYSGESFGIVLIEAMAGGSGVVIGGNNPGYQTVLSDTPECLVDVKQVNSFANLLHKSLTSQDFIKKTHKIQQSIVYKYDYKTVGQQILDEYYACLKHKDK